MPAVVADEDALRARLVGERVGQLFRPCSRVKRCRSCPGRTAPGCRADGPGRRATSGRSSRRTTPSPRCRGSTRRASCRSRRPRRSPVDPWAGASRSAARRRSAPPPTRCGRRPAGARLSVRSNQVISGASASKTGSPCGRSDLAKRPEELVAAAVGAADRAEHAGRPGPSFCTHGWRGDEVDEAPDVLALARRGSRRGPCRRSRRSRAGRSYSTPNPASSQVCERRRVRGTRAAPAVAVQHHRHRWSFVGARRPEERVADLDRCGGARVRARSAGSRRSR